MSANESEGASSIEEQSLAQYVLPASIHLLNVFIVEISAKRYPTD